MINYFKFHPSKRFHTALVIALIVHGNLVFSAPVVERTGLAISAHKQLKSDFMKGLKFKVTVNTNEGIVRLEIQDTHLGFGKIELTNEQGDVVYSTAIRLWDGSSVIDLEMADFEPGVFSIQFTSDQGEFHTDFTII